MADLIQFGAIMTAVTACPGGPRMPFFVGRQDRTNAALDGLLPHPTDGGTTTIALFSKRSFSAGGLAALIGAHTVSQQFVADSQHAGVSQDPTPGQLDCDYYTSTTAQTPPAGVFLFASDVFLARHGDTAGSFSFSELWAFAAEYLRLSILGVYNLNLMKGCTGALHLSTFQE
ncbi:ligninase h2 precursor [Ophiostoma piceae UAMH 11346]|uniref:Peroxidase n=1 Tax=Ophiostoma piceae (strain UAMH 11346) TaxID=1262450 RepID=S3BTT6_OPHP1|nr:ligninase h2 precursor [Ophiostoma piceae UAMH 11346]